MRRDVVKAVVFVLASIAPAAWPAGARAEGVRWHAKPSTARAEAERLGRPMFVLVTSAGCGWCRKLEETTLHDPKVIRELNARTIPIRIDADDPANARLLDAMEIDGLPTSAIVGPDGRIRRTLAGYRDPSGLLGWLHQSISASK